MNEPVKTLAVLIVEDMESDAQLIVRLFKKAGYELVYEQVETAEQMRFALEQRAWDIVISDYKMPQFDGHAALKLLQETGRDIPFIVVSGTIGEETAVAMMKAGAHDYLIKGNLARLIPAVERELEQSAIRRNRIYAEEALKESEEKYRELVQDLPDSIVIYINGKIVFANNAYVELMRAKNVEELLGRSVIEFVHPDFKEFVENRMSEIIREGKPLPLEDEKFIRFDGTEVNVEVKALPITFEKRPAIQLIVRDITARKQADEALRASEERYRSLFDRMLDGIYRSTHAGKFIDVNPAMVKMFGYSSKEEMLAMDIKNELYFDPEERGSHVLDTGRSETDIYRLRRKDGSEIWVEDRGNYTHDEQGGIVFHEGIMRDVTERVQAEKALAASESKLRALVEQVPAVVYTESADARKTIYISPQVEKLTGYSPAEWDKDRDIWKKVVHPEDMANLLAEDERTNASHEPFSIEYRILTRDGRTVWIRDEAVMIQSHDGAALFWQGVMYDVTERRQTEELLHQQSEQLKLLYEASQRLNRTLDLHEIYQTVCDFMSFIAANDGLIISSFDPETQLITCRAYWMDNNWLDVSSFPAIPLEEEGKGTQSIAIRTGQPMLIKDYQMRVKTAQNTYYINSETNEVDKEIPPDEEDITRSALIVPLKIGGKVSGAIQVTSYRLNAYTENQLKLLESLALHIASAEQNAMLYAQVQAELNERIQAQEILRASEEKYRGLFNSMIDGFALHEIICDENGKPVDYRFLEINPAYERLTGLQAVDLIGKTVLEVTPKIESYWMDIYGNVALTGRPTFYETHSGELGRYFEVSAYRPQPGQVAAIMVDITERKRAEQDIRRRVTELETLYESGLALSQLLNPKEIGQKILGLMEEKLNWHHTTIRLYHPEDESLELLAFHQPNLETETERHSVEEHFKTLISKSGDGLSGWAVKQSEIIRSGDVLSNPHYIETCSGLRSGLYIPMKLGKRIVGVISIEDEQPNAFSEADERLISTIANQAASAFENAHLFEVTRQRVMELETLNRISLVLRAVSNQDEMLAIILDEALAILNTSHGSIELWNTTGGNLRKTIMRGWLAKMNEPPQNSDEGIIGKVFASGETYISREFASDPETRAESRSQIPPGWGGICLPIRTTQQTLGVLVVSVPSERGLNRDEIRLLTTLSEMTGAALQRMQLYEETMRRAEEFASLYETSKILSAENDLNILLKTIVEHAQVLLNSAASGIYLYDEQRQDMGLVISTGQYIPIGIRLKLGESVAGRVAQTRQPLRIDDYSIWDGRTLKFGGVPFRAVLDVPMLYGGELIGVLTADETGDSERKFSEADERLLTLFASQAAGAIHSARLHEETIHRLKHLQVLRVVDQAISSSLDMRLTLNILLTHAISQLGVDAADVFLLHPDSNLLELMAGRGFYTLLLESINLNESLAGRAVTEHRTITVFDLETAAFGENKLFEKFWKKEGFSACWCVPLIVKGEAKGVLEVYRRTVSTPDSEWIEFLETLAGQAAIAIENAQLFENLQHANSDIIYAYDATIKGWSRAMELRDAETEGHTQRVADLTVAIAKAMGITDQEIPHIRRGALLHDIGKMGIPDHILLKSDELTEEEWNIMRTHPELARDMLTPIAYLRDALHIPYCHHETWDGTGYPQGLKGEQIPLTARLFAIVDVWDALTSDRRYRKKWTKKKTLAYIKEQRGKRFDPDVVDVFLKIVK